MNKSIFLLIIMFVLTFTINAQNDTMYIIKQGNILGKYKVSDVDSVIFYKPFTSNSNTVTDIVGNVYKTVTIGTQVWMAENLKTSKYNNGTSIPIVTDNKTWLNLKTPGFCWYNNDIKHKGTYGALYNWYTVNTGKLCPTGWHVPTETEWTTLTTYLGGESVAGGKMKTVNGWSSSNTGASNSSGFSALPAGQRQPNGNFYDIGGTGFWWSASEYEDAIAWACYMASSSSYIYSYDVSALLGYSVRCVRDN
jgi:uncharacterized protein (TIGR02145 family)